MNVAMLCCHVRREMWVCDVILQTALSWLHEGCMGFVVGGSRGTKPFVFHPPRKFLYRIATVKPGKMVHFRAVLFLGYLPSVNDSNFIENPGNSDFIEISS